MSTIRLTLRIVLFMLGLALFLLPLALTWQLRLYALSDVVRVLAFRTGALLFGLRVRKEGVVCPARPLLIVSNHFSYLDVYALGSLIPARFTPKIDVASWPVIGLFCRICDCIFIDRRTSRILHNRSELDYALFTRKSIVSLFPEGTTNDATQLLPFKSSFLSMVEHRDVMVQPVSIIYTSLAGKPVTLQNRHVIGWYADMEFFPHLLEVLRQPYIDVTIRFHSAILGSAFESRKEIARYCHDIIDHDVVLKG